MGMVIPGVQRDYTKCYGCGKPLSTKRRWMAERYNASHKQHAWCNHKCRSEFIAKIKGPEREKEHRLSMYRRSVKQLSGEMFKKLEANDDKGGWEYSSFKYLFNRLHEELEELEAVVLRDKSKNAWGEAADVANFAMMIAENAERRK